MILLESPAVKGLDINKCILRTMETLQNLGMDLFQIFQATEKTKLLCEFMSIRLRDEKYNEEFMAKIDKFLDGQRLLYD